jgi:predicted ribosomally synthesized peptide with nif11-like leader
MSVGQIEQFYGRVNNDPALFNKLMADTQTPDEFIDKAVAIGAETGFSFSRDEADAWIKKQIEAKASGELSDLQLEGVAGGKSVVNTALNVVNSALNTTPRQVINFLTSW